MRPAITASNRSALNAGRLLAAHRGGAVSVAAYAGVWARWDLTGEYQTPGLDADLEAAMRAVRQPVLSLRMVDDWFVTPASSQWLTDKLGCDRKREIVLDARALGLSPDQKADHYVWMRQPERIVAELKGWVDSTL